MITNHHFYRSKFDWMENHPYQYRSMSIHYLNQPRLSNQNRSLFDDSVFDRYQTVENFDKTYPVM